LILSFSGEIKCKHTLAIQKDFYSDETLMGVEIFKFMEKTVWKYYVMILSKNKILVNKI
jgi:hypothetical protein